MSAEHGTLKRYQAYGCRCAECRAAKAATVQARRQARAWIPQGAKLAPDDPRHGTVNAYGNFGCRCEACTAVASEAARRRKAAQAAREAKS